MAESEVREFSPCRLIGLAGVLIIIAGAILIGGGAAMFIHIPSMAFTFGIAFFILLATFGTDFLKFIPHSILTFVYRSSSPNPRFAKIPLFACRYIIGAGLMGALIGLIQMLRNLSSPDQIGYAMAVALITPFYAIVASEIFCAFLYKAYSDGEQSLQSKTLPLKNVALPAAVVAFTLILFFVLLAAFTSYNV